MWPLVPLGEFIKHRKEFIQIEDSSVYKLCRVQWYGQGVALRGTVPGLEVKTKAQQICRTNDFIVAEIDAKEGGFGIVPLELDGAIVSGHYYLFDVDQTRLHPRFLAQYVRTAHFRDQVQAQGSTNYSAVRASDVCRYTIPVPPRDEQLRLATAFEKFAEKHAQIIKLREESNHGLEALCRSILFSAPTSPFVPIGDLVSLRQLDTTVERQNSYQFAGVYCFGKGVFKGQKKNGTEFAYDRLTKIRAGEFTYPKLMAWEGALGIVPPECDGCFVSPEYPVFTVDSERVLPEVLDVYFRTPSVWPILAEASTGTNVRRRRLHPSAFLNLRMPVPPMAAQLRIRKTRQASEAIFSIRRSSETEVAALLGSVLNRAFSGPLAYCGQPHE